MLLAYRAVLACCGGLEYFEGASRPSRGACQLEPILCAVQKTILQGNQRLEGHPVHPPKPGSGGGAQHKRVPHSDGDRRGRHVLSVPRGVPRPARGRRRRHRQHQRDPAVRRLLVAGAPPVHAMLAKLSESCCRALGVRVAGFRDYSDRDGELLL